MIIPGKDNNL
ncbi:hypothetical protein CP8484711_2329, partial [Chlamydia psittaci 84-8471/1]